MSYKMVHFRNIRKIRTLSVTRVISISLFIPKTIWFAVCRKAMIFYYWMILYSFASFILTSNWTALLKDTKMICSRTKPERCIQNQLPARDLMLLVYRESRGREEVKIADVSVFGFNGIIKFFVRITDRFFFLS